MQTEAEAPIQAAASEANPATRLMDYCKVDMVDLRYKFVNFADLRGVPPRKPQPRDPKPAKLTILYRKSIMSS